ncbi:hypothetical protein ACLOJK_026463 [Asimina triloba]
MLTDALMKIQTKPKEEFQGESLLQIALESSKKAVIQGSMDLLLGFRQLLDGGLDLLLKLRDLIIDWVQEGFQEFFISLDDRFHFLSGSNNSSNPDSSSVDGRQVDKVLAGLEIAASFSGGGLRGYEHGPAFVPGEICRTFRSAAIPLQFEIAAKRHSSLIYNHLISQFTLYNCGPEPSAFLLFSPLNIRPVIVIALGVNVENSYFCGNIQWGITSSLCRKFLLSAGSVKGHADY